MKKLLKFLLYLILVLVLIIVVSITWISISQSHAAKKSFALAGPEVKTLTIDGFTFRDLNKNGKLDPYEDIRKPVEERVNDLLGQMTLEEKAGMMFMPPIGMNKDGSLMEKFSLKDPFSLITTGTSVSLFRDKLNHFNVFIIAPKRAMAEWYNLLQKLAERTRLGIPVTIASDPRNHFSTNPLASIFAGDMSLFPEPLGLAATGDSLLVEQFANIARQEYLACGIRVALHPMADLATEPRWPRINGTFGEDAHLAAKMVYAYVKGFQGDSLGNWSVACMTKHFSGGGPQKEGIDPHLTITKGQVYPGHNFNYHLIPFEAALKAGTAEIMPYYGIPMDQTSENVGFSFNKDIITGLLRNKMHFDGVVCTDWGIISDTKLLGIMIMPARARGMEKASSKERVLKVINAGVDQFGGEDLPGILIQLVKEGKVSEARIDSSVRRLLRVKFKLGLFDNPFVNVDESVKVIGNPSFIAAGKLAQRKSLVLLKNDSSTNGRVLPLKKGINIYIRNFDPKVASLYGTVVEKPEQADIALIRINTPHTKLKGGGLLGKMFHSGDLDFKDKERNEILALEKKVPTIVTLYLERPAVIPEIAAQARGLIADFGAEDAAVLDVIFGQFNPTGKLPLEMPSSMDAVRNQKEDLPYDSEKPLFPFGFGLSYQEGK